VSFPQDHPARRGYASACVPSWPAPEQDSVAVVDSRFTSKEADVASTGADREGSRDTVLLEKRLQTLRNLRSGRGGGGGSGEPRDMSATNSSYLHAYHITRAQSRQGSRPQGGGGCHALGALGGRGGIAEKLEPMTHVRQARPASSLSMSCLSRKLAHVARPASCLSIASTLEMPSALSHEDLGVTGLVGWQRRRAAGEGGGEGREREGERGSGSSLRTRDSTSAEQVMSSCVIRHLVHAEMGLLRKQFPTAGRLVSHQQARMLTYADVC
jgi:hypothetical protein